MKNRDWNLIVAISGILIAIIAGFPAVYYFVRDEFLSPSHASPQPELPNQNNSPPKNRPPIFD
jgi:hypothetical protein